MIPGVDLWSERECDLRESIARIDHRWFWRRCQCDYQASCHDGPDNLGGNTGYARFDHSWTGLANFSDSSDVEKVQLETVE